MTKTYAGSNWLFQIAESLNFLPYFINDINSR